MNVYLLDIAALLRILELSHEALVTGIVTTKRFYLRPLLCLAFTRLEFSRPVYHIYHRLQLSRAVY